MALISWFAPKSSIFNGVRPLPLRPIKPAGSKTGTIDNARLNKSSEDQERPEHQDVNAIPGVPRLIAPTSKSKQTTQTGVMMVISMETRSHKGNDIQSGRIHQYTLKHVHYVA